ncbi:MAG: hypothetical protein RBS80_30010 [Thermoguttaceae bacterium]|jgi:hypothetical protein|nr:hypothetical protein [Thermoguttaceae bacterium]
MSLMLNLPPELETELSAEASRMGLALPDYVERLLLAGRPLAPVPCTGAELVSYWQSEGLVGSRADIADSQDHARSLRQRAEQRDRP